MTLVTRLEQVVDQLARTPYEPGLVAEGVLLRIAAGRPVAEALQDLVRLSGDRSLAAVLGRIADSPERLQQVTGQVFLLDGAPEHRAVVREALALFARRLPEAWTPSAVIEFSSRPAQPTFAHVPGPGFAYVLVGPREGPGGVEGAIVHELAHAVFVSGQRFLDEGAASWLEADPDGPPPRAVTGLSLRTLLRHDAASDPYLTGLADAPHGAAHEHAAAFVRWLADRLGADGLRDLYDSVRNRPAGTDVETVVETSIGLDLEQIDRALSGAAARVDPGRTRSDGLSDCLIGAFIRMDHQTVESVARRLAETDPLDDTDEPEALALWARIAIFRLLSTFWKGRNDPSQIAAADAVLARLRRADPAHPSLPVLMALCEIGRLSAVDNELAGMTQVAIVQGLLDRAAADAPDDVEVRYHKAIFTLMTPADYADGRDEALEALRRLMDQPRFRDEIRGAVAALGGLHGVGRTTIPKAPPRSEAPTDTEARA